MNCITSYCRLYVSYLKLLHKLQPRMFFSDAVNPRKIQTVQSQKLSFSSLIKRKQRTLTSFFRCFFIFCLTKFQDIEKFSTSTVTNVSLSLIMSWYATDVGRDVVAWGLSSPNNLFKPAFYLFIPSVSPSDSPQLIISLTHSITLAWIQTVTI